MQTQRYETVLRRFQEGFDGFTSTCQKTQLLRNAACLGAVRPGGSPLGALKCVPGLPPGRTALQRDDTVGNHPLLHQGLYAAEEDLACDRRNETLSDMGIKGIKHKPQLLTLLNEVARLDAAV